MRSSNFKQGIKRLQQGQSKGFHIALMCAEKGAATCHRSLLIGYALKRLSISMLGTETDQQQLLHISHVGEVESQNALEARIWQVQSHNTDLFSDPQDQFQQAYRARLKATSYIKPAKS